MPLDAGPFLATLRILGYQLQDQRYSTCCANWSRATLIDRKTGKWSRYGSTLANPMTRIMCEMIEETIAARGFTEREAIADAVVELGLDAASFRCGLQSASSVCWMRTAKPWDKKPA